MKFTAEVQGIHEGEPVEVKLEVEFERGEYVEVVKQIPTIIKEMKELVRTSKKERKNA